MLIPRIEPSDNGTIVGGSVNSLLRLTCGLSKQNVGTKVVTSTSSKGIAAFNKFIPDLNGFCIFANDRKPQSTKFALTFLWKTLIGLLTGKFKRADIVHGHSGYAAYAFVTYLLGKIIGCPKVHTLYCPVVKKGTVDNKEKWVLKGELSKFALKKMDMILAMSRNIASSLFEAGIPKEKIVVMPTAIDTIRFSPRNDGLEVRKHLKLSSAAPVILYVGNLMKSKGLFVLLEAFSGVVKKIPDSRLIVTFELKDANFDKRHVEFLKKVEKFDLRNNVIELAIVSYMSSLMAAADLVVSPYVDTQGPSDYPLALMEAMATGRCVIGTKVGGIPELIEDGMNGVLVPPSNPLMLDVVITDLLRSHEKRKRMGKSARQTILEKHSIDKVAGEHLYMYKEVLSVPN
jgi:glycosyltransferase involved in cell wall biosynthesis